MAYLTESPGVLPNPEHLPLPLWPDPVASGEMDALRDMQRVMRADELRQKEAIRQVSNGVDLDIQRVLGIEELGGFAATRELIRTVLQITERLGYIYKVRFARPRPNAVDLGLRPFLSNPPHAAYPSNHTFQHFSVAQAFSRAIPEIRATQELFFVAQRTGENREYAGLHYRSDTEVGKAMASAFAPYLFQVCRYKMRAVQREWY
ncbi:MAG: phosphatase PAP2 family protein [Pseudomonadota bacterium]